MQAMLDAGIRLSTKSAADVAGTLISLGNFVITTREIQIFFEILCQLPIFVQPRIAACLKKMSIDRNVHIEYLNLSRIALYSRYRATHHKRSHANFVLQQTNGYFQHKRAKEFYVKGLLVK